MTGGMYQNYFGLKDNPFSLAPDPHYLYMSEAHREALAHLLYGIQNAGGFVMLTGEVGTGKTTVCRCLLEQIPENTKTALVLNPKLTACELLATICDELGIEYPEGNTSIKVFIDGINRFLLKNHGEGNNTVLIIDEAQNLSADVLEQVRLLTNLETNRKKLLQVIMLGQPELREILERPELRQLAQRITARYHLQPLSKEEIRGYVCHRLAVAGIERPIFPPSTMDKLYRLTGGVPRLINALCDRALLGAYVQEQIVVSPSLLERAAVELFGERKPNNNPRPRRTAARLLLLAIFLAAGALGAGYFSGNLSEKVQPSVPTEEVPQATKPADPPRWSDLTLSPTSQLSAEGALLGLWGLPQLLEGDKTLCSQAARNGLRCLSDKGSLGNLFRLDRPAVLKLIDSKGGQLHATLIALDEQKATLTFDGESRVLLATTELLQHWLGDFTLLWQPPPGYRGAVRPGDKGPVVAWVERSIAPLFGRQPEPNPVFEGRLVEEVQRFQEREGLIKDGIAGPNTLIHLNSRTNDNQPRLKPGRQG
jgi:general secretion pathway protein A